MSRTRAPAGTAAALRRRTSLMDRPGSPPTSCRCPRDAASGEDAERVRRRGLDEHDADGEVDDDSQCETRVRGGARDRESGKRPGRTSSVHGANASGSVVSGSGA